MSSLTILLIRHAEKPEKPDVNKLGSGLTPDGKTNKHSLVVRGWQRAGAWAALFGSGAEADFPRPGIVYAADPEQAPVPDGSRSKRPYQTILPLCARLHIDPITTHGVGDEPALVEDVQRLTGVVLICWEHNAIITGILPGLAKDQELPTLPSKWDGARFDVVLRFDRLQSGAPWTFRQLFPRLLSGDLDVPVSRKK
jgi:hypothetical protein